MLNSRLALAEPLVPEGAACKAVHSRANLTLLVLLSGFLSAIFWTSTSRHDMAVIPSPVLAALLKWWPRSRAIRSGRDAVAVARVRASATIEGKPFEPGILPEFVSTSSGLKMPRVLYGTECRREAGSEAPTVELVMNAVFAGFRGLDTAGRQEESYFEPEVGAALASLFASDNVTREDMFIQAKVNSSHASELYPDLPIAKQVEQSIAKSLSNLGLEYIDSLVLDGPYPEHEATMEAWSAMEAAVQAGTVRQLGIANLVSLKQLRRVFSDATLKPAIVQQRELTGFDYAMRSWCAQSDIRFQSFWPLARDSNGRYMLDERMSSLADTYGVRPSTLYFRFAMGLGIVPLTGTISRDLMREYALAREVDLSEQDAENMNKWLDGMRLSLRQAVPLTGSLREPLEEPAGWFEEQGGLRGIVATDGTQYKARPRRTAWGLWAPMGNGTGVSLSGPLPGEKQTVPRAELWAVIMAVERAEGPINLLIDNSIVLDEFRSINRDPEGYRFQLDSELVDLLRVLRGLLAARPRNFFKATWVPSHTWNVQTGDRKTVKRLAKARWQLDWSDIFLDYNARADMVASRGVRRKWLRSGDDDEDVLLD